MIIPKIAEQQNDLIRNGLEDTIKTTDFITENVAKNKIKILRDFTLLPVPSVPFLNLLFFVLLFLKQVIIQLLYSVAIFCTSKETISFGIAILPL